MAVHDLRFDSSNGQDVVHGWLHTPVVDHCRGLVQVAHGFGEHARRYLPLVHALNDAGYAVAMDDHLAHGTTAVANDSWGLSRSDSADVFIEDEQRLRTIAQDLVPDVPYLVFGHSWGSMIMREFVAQHGEGIAAAVFCGTTGMLDAMTQMGIDAAAQVRAEGLDAPTEVLNPMLGSLVRRYGPGADPLEWISAVPAVLADYAADPFNAGTRPFSAGFAAAFADLYARIDAPDWAGRVPSGMPVLFVSGDQDPVGSYGSGVYQAANRLEDAGHPDVTTRLWTGVRHEVHNQPEVRDEVFKAVVEFFDRAGADAARVHDVDRSVVTNGSIEVMDGELGDFVVDGERLTEQRAAAITADALAALHRSRNQTPEME